MLGETAHFSALGRHDEYTAAVSLRAKRDAGGIWREGGLVIVGGVMCQAQRLSTHSGLYPDFEIAVSAPVR